MSTEQKRTDRIVTDNFMKLDDAQMKKVAEWVADGLKISEIQNRLASDLKITMTYMDVRLLVDDLKLTPKDVEPPKPPTPPSPASNPKLASTEGPGTVSVAVDRLARPGAVVSGNVTFSDGNVADWYFDQGGRLGLAPRVAGYRPVPTDLQQFQAALEVELAKLGL